MIDIHQLRVGNKFRFGTMIQTVLEIVDNTDRGKVNFNSEQQRAGYSHLILCEENKNQYKPIEIDGIPITPEALEKLGFEVSDYEEDNVYYQLDPDDEGIGFGVSIRQGVLRLYRYDGNVVMTLICDEPHFQFVHHLQNLFLDLKGHQLVWAKK